MGNLILNMEGEGDKHTYIEQASIEATCENCGNIQEIYTSEYLSYPEVGSKDSFGGDCENCGEEISVTFEIKAMQIIIEIQNP